ncbi:muconate/chloromuconate family cycloisomerase [uncultured Tateyamaria sp.]|uniref:muconate/chloromuconate family cycloisomerase n=1 Tax=uncultured Tateyamaria sp. TaxID=455651 RepID=UPI00263225CB|nr:muconate/chloromuconate family cycloisomerase [uncultured Tateyamaria sp.]
MRIENFETFLIDLPAIRPHRLANQVVTTQTLVILRLTTSDGVVGVGEATTIGGLSYGVEAPETIKAALDVYIRPLIVGLDLPPAVLRKKVALQIMGNNLAKSALDTAILDIESKILDVPAHLLLGGAIRDRLEVIWGLATGNAAQDIEEAEEMLASGRHRHFKIKVGAASVHDDVARVAKIASALGDRASLRIDANRSWTEIEARDAIVRLADAGVSLVEQPVDTDPDGSALRRLTAWSPIPIMADESVASGKEALALTRHKACDLFALKIGKFGGPSQVRDVAAIASAGGIGVYGGTLLEGTIGTLAAAHAFAALPDAFPFHTELFGPLLLKDDITTAGPAYDDFGLVLPTDAGLGVTIDGDKLDFYRRDRTTRQHRVATPVATIS